MIVEESTNLPTTFGLGLGFGFTTFLTGSGSSGNSFFNFLAARSNECLPVPNDTFVTKSIVTDRSRLIRGAVSGDGERDLSNFGDLFEFRFSLDVDITY